MAISLSAYPELTLGSIIEGKFPLQILSGLFSMIYPLVIIEKIRQGKYETNSLILNGGCEGERQRNNLRYHVIGAIAAYVNLLILVYFFAVHKPQPSLYVTLFVGANVSGYFLTMWLREALGMYGQLQTAIRTAGAIPAIIAETPTVPVAPVSSPIAAYKPMTPNAEAQAVRVGAGTGANP